MILFVDASAVVAMIAEESDKDALLDAIDSADRLIWSPLTCWESAMALAKLEKADLASAFEDVLAFGAVYAIEATPIGEAELAASIDASARYGKRSRHPAQLNMGDCFAYACAKVHGARLLYKGNDFAQTDMA